MKKVLLILFALCFCFGACTSEITQVPPTSNTSGDTYAPLRAFVADGCLYYDTGLSGESTPRCGTLDGKFTKTLDPCQTPQSDGECNFYGAEGYQNATSITKEVPIAGEGWRIFKKADISTEGLQYLPYCIILTGRMPNAVRDSRLLLLSESLEVTVRDIYWPLLSSQAFTQPKYQTCILTDCTAATDKWGLGLSRGEPSPSGFKKANSAKYCGKIYIHTRVCT